MLNRRDLMRSMGAAAVAGAMPSLSLARTSSSSRFVLVVLRGAVDGLALAAPYGDGNYGRVRGELAIAAPGNESGLAKLDGLFGLHPALTNVHDHYMAKDAVVIHAVASPYRERSHFDGQDLLENGASSVGELRSGWLNRATAPLGESDGSNVGNDMAIALAQNTPLVLRGNQSVTTWAPSRLPDANERTIARLQSLYADDEFFATRLERALRSRQIAGHSMDDIASRRGNAAKQFSDLMGAAARFLTAPDGPTIAVTELGGWDTHANQGTTSGSLANRFTVLDSGIKALREGLGEHWDDTVIAVVTEFGRTVKVNGTRGTDHGTATTALLLGGAVNGGNVVCDWPGLAVGDLYAGRDLMPTTDVRSIFKSILTEHLGLPPDFVNREVFPHSADVKPLENLILS